MNKEQAQKIIEEATAYANDKVPKLDEHFRWEAVRMDKLKELMVRETSN